MATRIDATVTTVDNMDNSQLPISDSRLSLPTPNLPDAAPLGSRALGIGSSSRFSSQRELDRDFDDDVDRLAAAARRRESPLTHCIDRALIQSRAQSLQHGHVADRAIAAHDDFEHDVPSDATPPCVVGVVGLDLTQQPRRLDAAARTEGAAAGAAAGSVANARAAAFAAPRALARPRATADARALALACVTPLLDHAVAVGIAAGRGDDRRDEHARRQGLGRAFDRLWFRNHRGHRTPRFFHATCRNQYLLWSYLRNRQARLLRTLAFDFSRRQRVFQAASATTAARSGRHQEYQAGSFGRRLRCGFRGPGGPPKHRNHNRRVDDRGSERVYAVSPSRKAAAAGDRREQRLRYRVDERIVRGSRLWHFRAQTTPEADGIRGAQKRCSGDQPDVARVDEGLDELPGHTRRARDLFYCEDVLKDLGHGYGIRGKSL